MTATYADRIQGVETSLAIKAPVKAATTANVTLSGAQTIDGVSVTTGDRVLVKDQTDATENGIYKVSTGAWTRAVDFDGARDVAQGTEVLIANGTVHANTRYVVSTSDPVIGSTSIAFTPTGGGVSSRVDITPFVADGATNSFEIPGVFIDKKNVFPFSGGIPQYPDQFSLSNDGTNTTVTATENFPEGALVYCYADAQQSVAAANADTITLPNGVSVRDAIALSYNTRAAFVSDVGDSELSYVPAGTAAFVEGLVYVRSSGATAISDLPGWLPYGDYVSDGHWGVTTSQSYASAGNLADSASKVQAAVDYCDTINYDGTIHLLPGYRKVGSTISCTERLKFVGHGPTETWFYADHTDGPTIRFYNQWSGCTAIGFTSSPTREASTWHQGCHHVQFAGPDTDEDLGSTTQNLHCFMKQCRFEKSADCDVDIIGPAAVMTFEECSFSAPKGHGVNFHRGDRGVRTEFDPSSAVDTGADTITLTAHKYADGDPVWYLDGGGSAIGGLTTATEYWVTNATANTIQLATNEANAGTGTNINLTSTGSGTAHVVISRRKNLVSSRVGRGTLYDCRFANVGGHSVAVGSPTGTYSGSSASTPALAVKLYNCEGSAAATATYRYVNAHAWLRGANHSAESCGFNHDHAIFWVAGRNMKFDVDRQLNAGFELEFDPSSAVDTGAETITIADHGLTNGDLVKYTKEDGETEVGGLSTGIHYYVVGVSGDDFQLATEPGGSAINLTSAGSGTAHTIGYGGHCIVISTYDILPTDGINVSGLSLITPPARQDPAVLITLPSGQTIKPAGIRIEQGERANADSLVAVDSSITSLADIERLDTGERVYAVDSDQTVTTSTTEVNISDLAMTVVPYERFWFEATLEYSTNATADIKFDFITPAGATCRYVTPSGLVYSTGGSVGSQVVVAAAADITADGHASSNRVITLTGFYQGDATPGTFAPRFAQNTSDAGNTVIKAGFSRMTVRNRGGTRIGV